MLWNTDPGLEELIEARTSLLGAQHRMQKRDNDAETAVWKAQFKLEQLLQEIDEPGSTAPTQGEGV